MKKVSGIAMFIHFWLCMAGITALAEVVCYLLGCGRV